MKISKEDLRNYYINYHGFGEFFELTTQDAIKRIFERIKSVQFDPLNVVGRNAELALFARIKDFTRQDLHDALYKDGLLVDGWDKMMCIYARDDFAKFRYAREKMAEDYRKVINWRAQNECYSQMDNVYEYILEHGPIAASSIPSDNTNNGRWGPSKIAGVCCEYLWFCGKIAVAEKKGVVKIYDVAKRLLGENAERNFFDNERDFLRWYVKRRISSVGALWNKNGGGWLGVYLENKVCRTDIIEELVSEGELTKLTVDGVKDPFCICKGDERYFAECDESRAVFVPPLDNMIWDRKLVKTIFDFDYSWEVYVPSSKRKYGYYVLPILIGNRFVGRFEPMQYRPDEPLRIKNFWAEPNCKLSVRDSEKIMAEFARLGEFLNVKLDVDSIYSKISF